MADMSPLGSRNQPVLVLVSADQDTIVGDGSPNNPLRTADSSSDDFVTAFAGGIPKLGQAVRSASASTVAGASASSATNARVVGVIVALLGGTSIRVRTRGVVVLTESQWDVIAQGSGGLDQGAQYYAATTVGNITTDIEASIVAQVGVALSSTRLILSCPAVPRAA